MATQYTAGLSAGQVLTAATMNSIGAAWEDWTPQLWQGANVTSTKTYAKYTRINKLVIAVCDITATAAGVATNAIEVRSLPVTATNSSAIVGAFAFLDTGTAWYAGTAVGQTTTSLRFYFQGGGNHLGAAVTLATNDYIRIGVQYEGV